MACKYTLDWLDSLVNISLNPAKSRLDADAITSDQVQEIKLAIEQEKLKHQHILNDEVFRLLHKEKIEVLVNQYYSTLISLLDQSWQNQSNTKTSNSLLQPIYAILIQDLEELITFIEVRFSRYINRDQKAPLPYQLALKDQLNLFITNNLPQLEFELADPLLPDIINRILHSTLNNLETINISQVQYLKVLLESLKDLSININSPDYLEALIDALIYLNFNSPAFTLYLTSKIANVISTYPEASGKMEALLLLKKEYSQKQCNTSLALDSKEKDLSTLLKNWFNQEIWYWRNKYQLAQKSQQTTLEANVKNPQELNKVSCDLSVDQMSLLLRASADLQVIKARSLNAVFKEIVPHLSSATKTNLSWDSMRSKSYAVEKRDKDVVIQTLEKMIRKVKEY